MDLYGRVRLAVLGHGLSQRKAARRFGIDRGTVRKMLGPLGGAGLSPGGRAALPEVGGAYWFYRSDPGG